MPGSDGSENQRSPRALRRHVRLRCDIMAGVRWITGFTKNLSVTGVYVRWGRQREDDRLSSLFDPGQERDIRIHLPGQVTPISLRARIVWGDPEDRDITGQPAWGVRLHFVDPPAEADRALADFADSFRYTTVVVGDDSPMLATVRAVLENSHSVVGFRSTAGALEYLQHNEVAVVVAAQQMSPMSGLGFVRELNAQLPHLHTHAIVVSARSDAEEIRRFINEAQVFYYLEAPIDPEELGQTVTRAVDSYALAVENERLERELMRVNEHLVRENRYLNERVAQTRGVHNLVGRSPSFKRALAQLDRVQQTDVTVHIRGETGTGKELVARALHGAGLRKEGPFTVHNCAGMTETLLQSTLFGHTKGSFTGALRDHKGVFQRAHRGTLLLDEVAELPLTVQGSLLRVLQDGEVIPVGSESSLCVDVRVVSATHKELRQEVRQGRFREDLYFRLLVLNIDLPPLRKRAGDIALLASHFLSLHAQRLERAPSAFTAAAMDALERYRWPGNVRELENEVERALVLAGGNARIGLEMLSTHIAGSGMHPAVERLATGDHRRITELDVGQGLDDYLQIVEERVLRETLARFGGNQTAAAKHLKLPRQTMRNRMRRLRIVR